MAILDLQGMENQAPATGGGGHDHSASSASCAPSDVSLLLCHESVVSVTLC